MSSPDQNYAELMRLGRVHVMNHVPEQSRQSLPVPLHIAGALRVAFMYAPSQIMPGVNRMAPPHFVAWLDPHSGALIELKPVAPQFFKQSHGRDDMIGEFRLPSGMTADQYLEQRARLFELYAQLVPAWHASPATERHDLRAAAQEFLRSFGTLSEPPLMPYYYSLGANFFNWARASAK